MSDSNTEPKGTPAEDVESLREKLAIAIEGRDDAWAKLVEARRQLSAQAPAPGAVRATVHEENGGLTVRIGSVRIGRWGFRSIPTDREATGLAARINAELDGKTVAAFGCEAETLGGQKCWQGWCGGDGCAVSFVKPEGVEVPSPAVQAGPVAWTTDYDLENVRIGFAAQLTGRAMRIEPAFPKKQVVYLYAIPPAHTVAMTAAAEAIESLLSLIRRNAPELSGKVIGWAERDLAALRAIVGFDVPVQST